MVLLSQVFVIRLYCGSCKMLDEGLWQISCIFSKSSDNVFNTKKLMLDHLLADLA